MLGVNIVAAPTDAEARFLFSSIQQSFLNLRRGRPGKLPRPVEDMASRIDPHGQAMLDHALACAIVGGPETVRRGLQDFVAETGADELMVTAAIHDHELRKRSYTILAGLHQELAAAA
jgi:alkanesulfonate monooxygenase SsuD/methylene tetrahydromethanopterin reductase-like flavin-dependent oxidoreductase (luciferase family)